MSISSKLQIFITQTGETFVCSDFYLSGGVKIKTVRWIFSTRHDKMIFVTALPKMKLLRAHRRDTAPGGIIMEGKLRNMTSVYLLKGERVLLLYRQGGRVVNNMWTGSAGGHFEEYELNDARACVLRELQEELGLRPEDIEDLRLRYITLRSIKGEIRQNYYFFAELKEQAGEDQVSNEGISKWFPLDEICLLEMPFTAKYVMEHFCKTGRYTDKMYAGIANAAGVEFLELGERMP